MNTFPAEGNQFLQPLLRAGYAIWLIGSRANQSERDDSDWDFLIFGSEQLVDELANTPDPGNIDALLVYDGDNFRCPWPRQSDGVIKSGSLRRWRWNATSSDQATYRGSKPTDDWETVRVENAIRIWHLNPVA